jgi:hypothetical protein
VLVPWERNDYVQNSGHHPATLEKVLRFSFGCCKGKLQSSIDYAGRDIWVPILLFSEEFLSPKLGTFVRELSPSVGHPSGEYLISHSAILVEYLTPLLAILEGILGASCAYLQ